MPLLCASLVSCACMFRGLYTWSAAVCAACCSKGTLWCSSASAIDRHQADSFTSDHGLVAKVRCSRQTLARPCHRHTTARASANTLCKLLLAAVHVASKGPACQLFAVACDAHFFQSLHRSLSALWKNLSSPLLKRWLRLAGPGRSASAPPGSPPSGQRCWCMDC